VKRVLIRNLDELLETPIDRLLEDRRRKYRHMSEIEGRFPRLS